MPDAEPDEQPRPRGLTPRETTAVGALGVFVVSTIIGGFLIGAAAGCFATAGAAFVIAVIVGWQS